MRIISQDGKNDLPYESVAVGVFKQHKQHNVRIIAFDMGIAEGDNDIIMAIYSTEEKALKAMEMLRDAYCGLCEIKTKEPEKPANIDPGVFMVQYTSCKPNTEYSVWRFPKDEELE